MKILYLTDIHGSFDELELISSFAKDINVDLTIASGDLIETAFVDEDDMKAYKKLAGKMWSILKNQPFLSRVSPFEATRCMPVFAQKLLDAENPELKKLADYYLRALSIANDAMDLQYALIKKALEGKTPYLCVPGNYDKYLENTVLSENDLHEKSIDVKGVKISAYGSASDIRFGDLIPFTKLPISEETLPEIPVELTVPFNEYILGKRLVSEPYEFLSGENPDLVFTHMPARGLLDKLKNGENVGSPGIARYLMENEPLVICSGHVHESKGIARISKENSKTRVALNPGNFAQEKDSDYGNFAVIEIDENKKSLEAILSYKITNPKDIKSIYLGTKILRTEDERLVPFFVNSFHYQT